MTKLHNDNHKTLKEFLREIIESTMSNLTFYCDDQRHLVCVPYSIENLHQMASILGIKQCWFHAGKHPHYDIPKRRIEEIKSKCTVVSPFEILDIINTKRQ